MPITHAQAAKQAATNAVVDLVDVGAGANGTLEILDGAAVLVACPMSEPAFGAAAADGTATANAITATAATGAGTADGWQVKDEDGNVIFSGAARASADADNGEELVLDNTNIAIGQTVTVSSFTYKALSG